MCAYLYVCAHVCVQEHKVVVHMCVGRNTEVVVHMCVCRNTEVICCIMSPKTRSYVFVSHRRAYSHYHSVVTTDMDGVEWTQRYISLLTVCTVVICIEVKFSKVIKSRKTFVNKSRINSVV